MPKPIDRPAPQKSIPRPPPQKGKPSQRDLNLQQDYVNLTAPIKTTQKKLKPSKK